MIKDLQSWSGYSLLSALSSIKHFEATGGHLGTPGPVFFAGVGAVSNLDALHGQI